jgi:Skp family chaperone for outer membrane proteins
MSTEVEFGGVKFTGGKMFVLITALSTLGGASWGAFEVYTDYMDMKEIIQNIDTTEIANQNKQIAIKLDEAIDYTRDIKQGLRDDILGVEKQADRVEDMVRKSEERVRILIRDAETRFENKRDALQNDYDTKASDLRDRTNQKIEDVETRLNKKLQRALDNPLAN